MAVNNNVSKLILAFVALILGAVLIVSISTNAQNVTTKATVVNEVLNMPAGARQVLNNINESNSATQLAKAPTGWKLTDDGTDCDISELSVTNGTDTFAITTDYTYTAANGTFKFENSSNWVGTYANSSFVTYRYCGDDFVNIGWGRTVTNFVTGFFALALMGLAVGLFYSIAKDNDWF